MIYIKIVKYLIIVVLTFLLTGCGKESNESILKKTIDKIENANSYQINGELEMINNETNYKYDIIVDYMKKDYFKVSLKNKTNNHEQIILKNEEGVFVITPSLNKSFKFQSDWPYNNSQAYLLQSISNDLKKEKNIKSIKNNNNEIVYECNVNYINNSQLKKQKVYMDNKGNLLKVEVIDENNNPIIKMNFKEIKYNVKLKKDYFLLEKNIKVSDIEIDNSRIEDVVYPLYVPNNTKLTSHENIELEDTKRVIMDFSGDNSFTLIQEKITNNDEFQTTIANGTPILIGNVFGNLDDNSLNWYDQGVEYYIASDNLDSEEIIKVALSINNTNLVK